MRKARPLLAAVVTSLQGVNSTTGMNWLEDEIESIYQPRVVSDYQFPLCLLEFVFRSIRWKEGLSLLEKIFYESNDASVKLQIEIVIKRLYSADWKGGIFNISEIGPSIWDLIDRGDTHVSHENPC